MAGLSKEGPGTGLKDQERRRNPEGGRPGCRACLGKRKARDSEPRQGGQGSGIPRPGSTALTCPPAGAGLRGSGRGCGARPPPPALHRPPARPPGEAGRGVNRAAAVMSAGHMEPLMARDGSRRAGSCGSCCCGSGGGAGAPGSDRGSPCALREHRGLNDVFCDRSDER